MLIGLAAKNSILTSSSPEQLREQGDSIERRPRLRVRLRPILMTSFASFSRVLPLPREAPARARNSVGTTVAGGARPTFLSTFIPARRRHSHHRAGQPHRSHKDRLAPTTGGAHV